MRIARSSLLLDQNRPERYQNAQKTLARVYSKHFDTWNTDFGRLEAEVQRFAACAAGGAVGLRVG